MSPFNVFNYSIFLLQTFLKRVNDMYDDWIAFRANHMTLLTSMEFLPIMLHSSRSVFEENHLLEDNGQAAL